MTWTYNLETNIGKIRFNIGDINENDDVSLSNEEITYILSFQPNINQASITALETLIGRYAREATAVSLEGSSYQYSERIKDLKSLLLSLKSKHSVPRPVINNNGEQRRFPRSS